MYKQTASGIVRYTQETLLLALSLIILFYLDPELMPFDTYMLGILFGVVVVIWVISISTIDPQQHSTLSSDTVNSSFLEYSADGNWNKTIQQYASGYIHTDLYISSQLYSVLTRTVLLGCILSLVAYSTDPIYVLDLLALYILIPTLYASAIARSELRDVTSIEDADFDITSFNNIIRELSSFFDVEDPRIHVTESSQNDLYVVKSLLTDSTLVFSPRRLQNLAAADVNLDMADRFKLAHEFAHLSSGSKYTLYSQVSLIALSFTYYLVLELINLSPAIIVVVSTTFVLTTRLVINYIKRVEEFKSDSLAAEFIEASPKDCTFALISVTNSDENPFTYPQDSILGKAHSLFVPHPPIVSRINELAKDRD